MPALSEADAGIAVSDGAAIAQEIADITIAAESLWELARLRQLAMALNSRIRNIYRFVLGFNGGLIALVLFVGSKFQNNFLVFTNVVSTAPVVDSYFLIF